MTDALQTAIADVLAQRLAGRRPPKFRDFRFIELSARPPRVLRGTFGRIRTAFRAV